MIEQTLGMIKPNATKRNLTGKILQMIEEKGFVLKNIKMLTFSRKQAEDFYAVHKDKYFFPSLIDFMTSGKTVVFHIEGDDAVNAYRKLMGATDPSEADEGTIRKLYAESTSLNSVHGSDSIENATKELKFFFG